MFLGFFLFVSCSQQEETEENLPVTTLPTVKDGWWRSPGSIRVDEPDSKVTYRIVSNNNEVLFSAEQITVPLYVRIEEGEIVERGNLIDIDYESSLGTDFNSPYQLHKKTNEFQVQVQKSEDPVSSNAQRISSLQIYELAGFIEKVVGNTEILNDVKKSLNEGVSPNYFASLKDEKTPLSSIKLVDQNNAEITIDQSLTVHYTNSNGLRIENVEIRQQKIFAVEYIETLDYPTQHTYKSKEGFFADPIYSKIDFDDFNSIVKGFIEDARRYGRNLSHVDLDDIKLNEEPYYPPYSAKFCTDGVEIGLSPEITRDKPHYPYQSRMLFVIWHELGHDLLDLDHPNSPDQIMEPGEILLYDYPDKRLDWARAAKDMFEGKNQVLIDCENQ